MEKALGKELNAALEVRVILEGVKSFLTEVAPFFFTHETRGLVNEMLAKNKLPFEINEIWEVVKR